MTEAGLRRLSIELASNLSRREYVLEAEEKPRAHVDRWLWSWPRFCWLRPAKLYLLLRYLIIRYFGAKRGHEER